MHVVSVLRGGGAMVLALVVTFALLIAVELFSAVVHPFPSDFQGTSAEVCAHVARYPHWVLAVAVPMWGFTALVGTWIAGRLGHPVGAGVMAVLLLVALGFNLAMLPYPLWFKIVQPLAVVVAVAWAIRAVRRRSVVPAAPQG